MKTLHILSLKKPLPSTLHTISKSVYKSISVVVLLMTAFTVVLAPSVVHADKPTFQVIKVLTTDASGNSAPANDLRLGDKIRIVVRADAGDDGPPKIVAISGLNTLDVVGLTASGTEFPLVHPTGSGHVNINLVDFVDNDSNVHTGDLVYGYTIGADDRVTAGLSISPTNPVNVPHRIEDQHVASALNGNVTFASGVVTALGVIRADGSRVVDPPAARIEVNDHDPAARTYRVTVTFIPPPGRTVTVANFGFSGLTILDETLANADVSLVEESFSKNVYRALIKYAESTTLPLQITIKQGVFSTSNPDLFGTLIVPIAPTPPPKKLYRYECPVGWVRADWVRVGGASGRTRRALLYEVNLEMDLHHPVSIYKPTSVAIYVHPDEGLENLHGWKLQVAVPYNHHREYLLTAENSVVVASKVEGVKGGFALIANPEETPFPMRGMGFARSPAPGFDYRLYDDAGKRVDFGIACYKRSDIFEVLKDMEAPSVLRQIDLETLDWDVDYLRSEWTVPVPVNVPGAPSLQGANLVGRWADLKKQ